METYQSYYSSIEKPFFAPEPSVFGIAWGIIYPLIAVALIAVLVGVYKKALPKKALYLFFVNLVFNFAFTPLQLSYPEAPWATVDILAVLTTLLWLLGVLFQRKAWTPFFLLVPYALWASFATVLQVTIYFLNFA